MNVRVFIFTCERDKDILKYCLLSLKEAKKKLHVPDRLHVTLAYDFPERQSEDDVNTLEEYGADNIIYTTFNRKGNLNGSACVAGMLDAMVENSPDNIDWLCQLDSDCILQDFNYFKAIRGSLGGEALGFSDSLGERFACAGPGMCIKRDLALRVAQLAETPRYAARIDRGPGYSDTMIGALADILGYPCQCLNYESAELCPGSDMYRARVGMYFEYKKSLPNVALCRTSAIVHFDNKNASFVAGTDDPGVRHKLVLDSMKDWYESYVRG